MSRTNHNSSSDEASDCSMLGSSSPKLQRHRSPEAVTWRSKQTARLETPPPSRTAGLTRRAGDGTPFQHKPRRQQLGGHSDHRHKTSTRKHNAKIHKSAESARRRDEAQSQSSCGVENVIDDECDAYPLLRGGLELVRRLLVVKEETRKLVLLLRDAEFNGSPVALDQLLPPVARIATVLYQADGGATLDRWRAANSDSSPLFSSLSSAVSTSAIVTTSALESGPSFAVQTLAQTIGGAGAASRGSIVMQGWVVSTEWRGIWRHQYSEYACLCDDHTFYLFASRQQCAEHIFELNRSRDGHASDTSARIIKASAPRRTLSLSDGEWVVRRAETASKCADQQDDRKENHRQALAFFDQKSGDMRLILDVSSPREAEQWTRAIQTELDYSRLYARMRDMHDEPRRSDGGEVADPSGGERKALRPPHAVDSGGFSIPLRWLHARVDRLDGNARSERLRSRSFAQAVKDLQRDQLVVNGVMYPGANVERVFVAITRQLLALMDRSRSCSQAAHRTSRSASALVASDSHPIEMNALCFARQLVVNCSRTHGGGDILDTLHLMFNKERYCICPDTQHSSPVELRLHAAGSASNISDSGGQMCAEISLSMMYKVIPLDTEGNSLEDPHQDKSSNSSGDTQGDERRIVAVYTQRLVGAALEWREGDGSVSVTFA